VHITIADVISLNGKITKGDNPNIHEWSSAEDWQHFVQLRDQHDAVIIDRHTYETVRPPAELDRLRIVFTSTPERFSGAAVPGQLEFVNVSPSELAERLAQEGHQKVLIAGGARLCSDFLAAGLVDDVYSFEPVLFGTGKSMLSETDLNISLQLQSVEQLNERGTLLARYSVIKAN
jgi:dihydrofolate reductase